MLKVYTIFRYTKKRTKEYLDLSSYKWVGKLNIWCLREEDKREIMVGIASNFEDAQVMNMIVCE